MKSYAFDIGNSSEGPIGAVIRVAANSDDEATKLANFALDKLFAGDGVDIPTDRLPGVEYVSVFVNTGLKLTSADIGDVSED